MHGILFSIKLDHKISQVRHLNSPGAAAAFIILRITEVMAHIGIIILALLSEFNMIGKITLS